MNNKKYDKILIFQYGKVGSSSILRSNFNNKQKSYTGNAESYNIFKTNGNYNSFLIQTHKHEVAIDI